jgi:uncharacterized protein YjbI with pentapeptide repeats
MTDNCHLTAPTAVEFVGCDLCHSNWHGRDLSLAKMVDCKLYGVAGLGIVDELQITRGDISPNDDGSQITCAPTARATSLSGQVLAFPAPNGPVWS